MSNNHSHDNIYSILGKLEALKPTPEEKRFALVKEIRESVEAQGSIIEGVDAVQARLARQFAEAKKAKPDFLDLDGDKNEKETMKKAAKEKIEEKAVSQAQQKFMGMVHAAQKGSKAASPAVAKVAKSMGKKDATDFAATKHKGLPQHVNEKYNAVKAVKQCAKDYMEMNGICSIHDLEAEDIESIGGDCQMNYEDVCEILGCNLPDSLGPVKSWDTDAQGNKFDLEEATCNECGMYESKCSCTPTNEGETTRKDGVTTHRKTDFPGYPSDDLDDSEEDENKGKRGRPRKHAKKKETGEKRGRGRPSKHSTGEKSSKDSLPFSSKNKIGHDPFGRVKKDAEKTVAKKDSKKDSKKTVAENMDNLARRLTEGVNFANLLKEKHQTVDEMLAELSNDMKVFKETGHCSELLRDCMEIKGYHGKMMADEGSEQGIGQDLVTPQQRVAQATPPKPGVMNKVTDTLGGMKDWLTGKPENPTRPTYEEEDSLASELDELAKLAGLSEVSRGEYIKQQDTSAEKSGKNKFNAFGQIFNTDDVDEELEQEGTLFTKGLEDDDVAIGDKIPGTNAIKTKDIDTVDEAKVDVADAPEAVNKPRAKHYNIKSILDRGDDLNKKKQQYADKPKLGDNPMATLESQLAAEYESIKKVS
jgi:hypothetical protein